MNFTQHVKLSKFILELTQAKQNQNFHLYPTPDPSKYVILTLIVIQHSMRLAKPEISTKQ